MNQIGAQTHGSVVIIPKEHQINIEPKKRRLTADLGLNRLRKIFYRYYMLALIQSLKEALISCSNFIKNQTSEKLASNVFKQPSLKT